MRSSLSQRQISLINEIADKEGMKNYKVNIKQGSNKGDGYSGEIIFIDVEDESKKGLLYLVLKVAHKGDELRDNLMIGMAYEVENFIYDVVFKEYHKLQKEYNVMRCLDGAARYYGGLTERNEECLIFENLKELGFVLWNRKLPMNAHHVETVMATYGKFHALSYAMKALKPRVYQEFSIFLKKSFEKVQTKMCMDKMLKFGLESVFYIVQENTTATAALKRFADTTSEFFSNLLNAEDQYSVITHGDCWCNNMMFKYEDIEQQKLSKVYLLDWQISSIGSPIRDIAYFFYACSSKECLDTYETYLKIYHKSLSEMLQQFGIPVTDVMSFEELTLQWKKFAKFGLAMGLLALRVMLTEPEEVRNMGEVSNNDDTTETYNDNPVTNSDEFERRVRIIIDHMMENGFI